MAIVNPRWLCYDFLNNSVAPLYSTSVSMSSFLFIIVAWMFIFQVFTLVLILIVGRCCLKHNKLIVQAVRLGVGLNCGRPDSEHDDAAVCIAMSKYQTEVGDSVSHVLGDQLAYVVPTFSLQIIGSFLLEVSFAFLKILFEKQVCM